MSETTLKRKTITGLIWILIERIGNHTIGFIVSLILARLLMPEDYGVIAIVLVFINICDVFVVGGMGKALVQKKDADECDFSSIFYFNSIISLILYFILFLSAPYIAEFYSMPSLTMLIRVLGIRLFFAAYNTIQRAVVARGMRFRMFFVSTTFGTFISAAIGIWMAYSGFGVWALVGQNLSNNIINVLVLCFMVRWYPKLLFSWERTSKLFSFGWKLLVSNLIDALYMDFRSLYIGKLYTPADLAYYTRGRQFPLFVANNINSSISAVLFPALSKRQDNVIQLKNMTRRAIQTSSFIMMPIMFLLATIAEPLVRILLTDKWIECVPFLQILCFNGILLPIQTANIQAILALGRSDISLKVSIIKKGIGFMIIIITASYSVLAMAYGGILIGIIASIVNSYPNKTLLKYKYVDQIKDILPFAGVSFGACLPVYFMNYLNWNPIVILVLQCIIAIILYAMLSRLFKIESLTYIIGSIKEFKKHK